jgi:hypothetical protein
MAMEVHVFPERVRGRGEDPRVYVEVVPHDFLVGQQLKSPLADFANDGAAFSASSSPLWGKEGCLFSS